MGDFAELTDEDRLENAGTEPVESEEETVEEETPAGQEEETVEGEEATGEELKEELKEEPEEDDGPGAIPISYEVGGEVYEEDMTYDDIADAVAQARQLPQYQNYLVWTRPLVEHLEKSELLRTVHGWKDKGFSDEQIMKGLFNLQQSKEGGATEEPEAEDLQKLIDSKVNEKLTPLQQSFEQQQADVRRQQVINHNEKVFNEALFKITKKTYGELEEDEIGAIQRGYRTMFGNNANIEKIPVESAQAMMIIRDALVKGGQAVVPKAAGMKVPPKIQGGSQSLKTDRPGGEVKPWKEGKITDKEVKRRLDGLFI